MNHFKEDAEFIKFFTEHPEYEDFQDLFVQPEDSLPILKDGYSLFFESELMKWTSTKKSIFWRVVSIWHFRLGMIVINDELSLFMATDAFSKLEANETFHKIQIQLQNLQTDKEKYEYATDKMVDIEFLQATEEDYAKRCYNKHLFRYLKLKAELYERRVKVIEPEQSSSSPLNDSNELSNPCDDTFVPVYFN